ncbi:MAG TPA: outer membrane lipoprotein chaperone LolA [Pseudomonadales bacterium]|jgi:outer membrane lipoprotein carrier protein|nr:outer membrane lipoprotein chaperone LolA [Pseudomonadales bacterium]HNI64721.1 outer membrane lipoprotein chaperone LolA [Pseudomonadales bacterium]
MAMSSAGWSGAWLRCLFGLWMLWPLCASAQEVADELSRLLRRNQTLSADFNQEVTDGKGRRLHETHGHFWIKRPQLFRWEVAPPYAQLIVCDGKTLWQYDPELSQVVIKPFDARLAETPALLLSGDTARIVEGFRVTASDVTLGSQSGRRFELTPKAADSLVSQIELFFAGNQLTGMTLRDSLGQNTRLRFFALTVNGVIEADKFSFEPPAGVDIIRDQ